MSAHPVMRGEGDDDDFAHGQSGIETVCGGASDDPLYRRAGNDVLVGHAGADRFNVKQGYDQDQINDVTDDVDTIMFRNLRLTDAQGLLNYASQISSDVVFDFGDGNRTRIP